MAARLRRSLPHCCVVAVLVLVLLPSSCGAFVLTACVRSSCTPCFSSQQHVQNTQQQEKQQGVMFSIGPTGQASRRWRRYARAVHSAAGGQKDKEDGLLDNDDDDPVAPSSRDSFDTTSSRCHPTGRSPADKQNASDGNGNPMLCRRGLLEKGARAVTDATLALAFRPPVGSTTAGLRAGVTAGVIAGRGWGMGLREGVRSAQAFGGPSIPLSRCLVNAVNAREFCTRLEAELAAGQKAQECRGMVKSVLRGLNLQESLKNAALYLPGGKRQAALDAGQSAVEYLASVVEFDAWDKLDKDWTSNVALRNMTPDNVMFVRMALDASGSSLDVFLRQFDSTEVSAARELYRAYYLPTEEQEG